ncbi:VOC family protein [Peptoniphilus catoniae]|uniref:VOC family protein n=1 Tax=Peptoniphilus catoniae TaxID=1660341 RepID=UPI0010FE6CE2|nr:VOC family protein [Peptoniphilus catoniae]
MIKNVIHIGITVCDLEKAKDFYGRVLGLKPVGNLIMEGPETDLLFGKQNTIAKIAYFNGSDNLYSPPIELIEFNHPISKEKGNFFKSSVSEICFSCNNLDEVYGDLRKKGVKFISKPQYFEYEDSNQESFKAVYFYDMDENIMELVEYIK